MNRQDSDRNLLFGILALQMDFIGRDALIAAMGAWALEKHRPIGEILVERGALDPRFRALLEPMVEAHVERHRGDPAASLAALSSVESLAEDLRRSILDPDVLTSLARVTADPHATRAPDTADFHHPVATRYRKVRDHARGGLGIVYVALDEELRREVALKEIKPEYADNLASQTRFLLEAEITGGLEHPGIVPVYGLGAYEDGRPFYAMRFIKGDSLKDAIAAFHADPSLKTDPGARTLALQKLLRRFLDVCNAVAYAHSRGVLHRDLKPDNVMVGRYGETLVVDWGLAKSVGRSGSDGYGPLPESTVLVTPSSGSAETLPGSVVGTPGYMSPEQAAGRLDLLGPASDVYGLGATLYTLLTGRVPFVERDLAEVLRQVEHGEFPHPRESAPWLDPALEAITLKAMALRPDDRYRSPKALADDLERWLADEPVTAYREPWTRRARRWSSKHRTALATASTAILAVALGLGTFTWTIIDRSRRADATGLATLTRAEFFEAEARKTDDPARWSEAIAESRRAEAQLESGGGSEVAKARAKAKLSELQEALRVVEHDRTMVNNLEEARLKGASVKDGHFDWETKADAILGEFRTYGIDLGTLTPEQAAQRIRVSRIKTELLAALDEATPLVPKTLGERLSAVARLADTDARMADIRDRIRRQDFDGLRRLVADEAGRRELGQRCRTIFNTLSKLDPTASILVLEAIYRENRNDFWFAHDLAFACADAHPPRLESAIRYYHAAAALRPTSPGMFVNLGIALRSKGELDAAIAAQREAIRLKPDYAEAHSNLGKDLYSKGQLDSAIAACREAIRLKPDLASAHSNLGIALNSKGELDAAIAAYREAIRLKPDLAVARSNLGVALKSKGELDAAIAACIEAIRLKPDLAEAHYNLGNALHSKGELDAAIAAYREAIRLKPDYAISHTNLGGALGSKGELDAAIAACREAIRLKPDDAISHTNLANALYSKGELDAAIAAYREAIRLDPGYANAHYNLGNNLHSRGELDPAIAAYREAIRLKPDYAEALCNLGLLLESRGRFTEALRLLEKGHELGFRRPDWRYPSADWVSDCRRLVELDEKLQAILRGETSPKNADERLGLADLCVTKMRYADAARFFGEAFAERPALADDLATSIRYNAACAASLAGSGLGKDDPPPDEVSRTKLREQARAWLRADLASWSKIVEGGDAKARQGIVRRLDHRKKDSDLAGIRDAEPLAKWPEAEREACRALWADVEVLRVKAGGGK